MKKYNTLFVVVIAILFVLLLTWLLPITYLNGEFVSSPRAQAGLFDVFSYPLYTVYNFVYIIIYVLTVGGFYGVLNRTGAYRVIVDKIVKFIKGKENIFFIGLIALLSIAVSFTGFTFELLLVFPLIAAIILLLGYDNMTVALTMVGSVSVGVAGNTFSKLVVGTFNDILSTSFTDGILGKVAILVVGIALLVFNVVRHAKKVKVKKVEENSIFIPSKVTPTSRKTKTTKVWPLVLILSITSLIILLASLNWSGAFGITLFETITEKLTTWEVFNYTLLDRIMGTYNAFGAWGFNDIIILIMMVTLVIKLVYRVTFEELVDSIGEGFKNYLYTGIVMLLSYAILICISNHPVVLSLLKPILSITDGFNSVTLAISTFFGALFNSDFTYYSYGVLTLNYATAYITDTTLYPLASIITQGMYGLAMLIAPTSLVLLFSLTTLKITYLEWLKKIWQLFVELLVVMFIVFTILLMI